MSSTLPTTYKAAVFEAAGKPLVLRDMELKHPGPGQLLIKVLACGVCFSDHAAGQGWMGNVFPRVPGHEIVGDVVAVGDGVTRFTAGERVGGPWHGGHDGTCLQCQRGRFQMCEHKAINGVTRDGGYAEYVLLRAEAVVHVPRDMDAADAAPLLCAGVTVFNALRKLHVEQGALVAVLGLGGLGHLAVQFASRMGYRVVVLSRGGGGDDDDSEGDNNNNNNNKRRLAMQLGAAHFIDTSSPTGGGGNSSREQAAASAVVATTATTAEQLRALGGADVLVSTAPNAAAVAPLLAGLAPGGKLLVLAPTAQPLAVDTGLLVSRALSVHGWPSGHALDSEEAIGFARAKGVACMVERFPLRDAQAAFDRMLSGQVRFRSVLVMEE